MASETYATNGVVRLEQVNANLFRIWIFDWLHSTHTSDVKAVIQYQRLTMPLKRKFDPPPY